MAEKRVSVRLAAVGGQQLKGEFVAIGSAGKEALVGIAANADPAEAGMQSVEVAAARARQSFEELSVKAANSASAMRISAASASPMVDQINRLTGVTPAIGKTTAEYLQQGQALDQLRAKYNPVYAEIQRYRTAVSEVKAAQLQGALTADEMTAAIQRERRASLDSIAALKGRTVAINGMSAATRVGMLRTQQMFYQANDIGVSLISGMNPFVVMAQQGTQIAQIYGFGNGGVGAALQDISNLLGGLVRKFGPVLAIAGAFSAVIGTMTGEINKTADVTVTFGDTALAVWQTIRDGLFSVLRPAIEKISGWFSTVWGWVVDGAIAAGNLILNTMKITALGIKTAADTIPEYFRAAFSLAVSYVVTKMHDMVWYVSRAVNGVAEGLNSVFDTNLSTDNFSGILDTLSQKSGDAFEASQEAAGRASAAWSDFGKTVRDTVNENPLGDLFANIKDKAISNALNRLSEDQKKAGGAGRKAGEQAKEGWDAAKDALTEYARSASDWGKGIGDAMVNGFQSAESAFKKFAEGGKVDFRGLIQSILADMALLQFKSGVLGPLADFLSGIGGGSGGGFFGKLLGKIMHIGGTVGAGGMSRQVPAVAFAGAQRFHDGGWPGLKPDEVPVIAQRYERIWSKQEVAQGHANGTSPGRGEGMSIAIDARGAQMGVAEQIEQKVREMLPGIFKGSFAYSEQMRRRGVGA